MRSSSWLPAHRRGRKKAALTYVASYVFGCFTKHFNNFNVLFVGRIFCGVATSLLFSAFESWLVAEHFKVGRLWFRAMGSHLPAWMVCCKHSHILSRSSS